MNETMIYTEQEVANFKKYMQESFQYRYESVYGNDKLQVLPEKDIIFK